MQRKTQIGSYLLLLGLTALIMTACQTKTKKATDNPVVFDDIQVERTYHMMDSPDNPNCNLQIDFTYPVKADSQEQLKTIQDKFVSAYFGEPYEGMSPKEAVEQYTTDYLDTYKEMEEDFRIEAEKAGDMPIASWFSYYEMSSNEVVYNKNGLLSFSVYFEGYTGGAHGSHSQTNHVLDLSTGEFLLEEDLFVDNYQDKLARILVDKIAKQNEVADSKELENIGFFSVEEIYPNGNFLIEEDGLMYIFNEYEIAAYVVGITSVHLPYSEIRSLLKEGSPIAALLNE